MAKVKISGRAYYIIIDALIKTNIVDRVNFEKYSSGPKRISRSGGYHKIRMKVLKEILCRKNT